MRLPAWTGRPLAAARTIRVRLTLWYLAILAVTLAAFSTFLFLSLSHVLTATHDQDLLAEASEVSAALQATNPRGKLTDLPTPPESDAIVSVFDAGGERLLGANDDDPPRTRPAVLQRAAHGELVYGLLPKPGGGQWRTLTLPVVEDGQIVAVMSLARPRDSIDANLAAFERTLFVAVPLTLLLALAGGLFLANRALSPIDRVTRAAETFGASDFSLRLNMAGPQDEVARLAGTFDRMLARIEQAFQRERQFTADASHELRTPLALLLSRAEIALHQPRSAAEYNETLVQMQQDLSAMERLLNELLLLARAEAGRELLTLETLQINDLVTDVVEVMRPRAEASGVRLTCQARPRVAVEADQTRLTQVLLNLIENAVKFTPPGGSVSVTLRRREGMAEIGVADTGPGIPAEHLPHIFERFYRADPARSRAGGGTGLGLTISQWIAQAHGGELTVRSREGHGATFTLRLPIKEAGGTLAAKKNRQPLRGGLAARPLHASLRRVRS